MTRVMRNWALSLIALLPAPMIMAQVPDQPKAPPLPQEAKDIFAIAAPLYDFNLPTLQPWHMKVTYQLFDEKNASKSQGTYEYWWASRGTYRSTWKRPGMEHTDWQVEGQHYQAETGEPLPYFERKLQSEMVNPLPTKESLDPEKVRFVREERDFSGVKLPCVILARMTQVQKPDVTIPTGLFPTYCFDTKQTILRTSFALGANSVIYNKIAPMQGVFLAHEVAVFDGARHILSAQIDVLNRISPTATELKPTPGLAANKGMRVQVGSAVEAGLLMKKVEPGYPIDARSAGISGKVVLHAFIGTDGHVQELSVVEGPSPSLIGSAILAVSQWEYRPYLLKGVSLEVDTTVNVIFSLGKSTARH